MIKKIAKILVAVTIFVSIYIFVEGPRAVPLEDVKPDSRCAVCGMFVTKYEVWITQIRHRDDTLKYFDGVKDMMAYYFTPEKYGGAEQKSISEVWVKDYYTLKWLDGRNAFYVSGSDVHGPMGHELVPFSNRAGGEAFLKDHHGEKIYAFSEITPEIVEALRAGNKMKH